MKTRGRPRHPETLTPRQQEVLALVRQGLTNEEIAQRLGISLDGAKWHVSEILMRLGVESRHEAAAWSPALVAPRRFALLLAPMAVLHKVKLGAIGYAAVAAGMAVVAAAIALLAWGVFQSSATQDAAVASIGDQVFFTTRIGEVSSLGRTAPIWNISTYDVSEKRIVHSFNVGADGDIPTQAVLAGDQIVVNLESRIVEYDLDGSNARELRRAREGGAFLGIGASPDGTLLAVTEQTRPLSDGGASARASRDSPFGPITNIVVINLKSQSEIMALRADDPRLDGFRGQPAATKWRDDGRGFIVTGDLTGTLVSILLDGTVRIHSARYEYQISPSGRFVLDDETIVCDTLAFSPRHYLAIRTLDDDRIVSSLRDNARVLDPVEWSPDGTELIFESYPSAATAIGTNCPERDTTSPRTYHVLLADGSPAFDVSGVADARRRWYGDRAIEYRCNGVVVVQPYCQTPSGSAEPIDAYAGGALIASGVDFRLIPNPPRPSAATGDAPTLAVGSAKVGAQRRTGIPEVDRVIDLLVRTDVDGLAGIAEYASIGCSVAQTVGSPPPCALGQADGTIINAFPWAQCEGTYVTESDQLKAAFELALQRQPSAAIYAALRDNTQDRTYDNYWIAATRDRPSQATADVSCWGVTAAGKIIAVQNECGPTGAAQQVAYRFPVSPDFVLGPYNNCSPPPGETPNFMITVESLSPGGIKPQFWGEAQTTLGEDTGERAIVTVSGATKWSGGIDRLEDVRQGMLLQAVGKRQPDCTIVAETILTPLPSVYHDAALGLEMPYPFNWPEGAPAMPYATCNACAVLGPKDVHYPYGIQLYTQALSPGCDPSCAMGNNAVSRTAAQTLFVDGHQASQQEFERQTPLGVTNETGETTPYREIVTVISLADQSLIVDGFYRYGDVDGERYVRRAYANALGGMKLPPP